MFSTCFPQARQKLLQSSDAIKKTTKSKKDDNPLFKVSAVAMAMGAVLGIPHRVLEVWTCGLSRKRLTGLPLTWGGWGEEEEEETEEEKEVWMNKGAT